MPAGITTSSAAIMAATLAQVYPGAQSKIVKSAWPSSWAARTKSSSRALCRSPENSSTALRSSSYKSGLAGSSCRQSPICSTLSLHSGSPVPVKM